MPHLVLEYTENVASGFDPRALILKLSDDVLASGQFQKDDIKARAIQHDVYAAGLSSEQGFVHLKLSLLAGRAPEIRKALAQTLMTTLRHGIAPKQAIPLSVEIAEMERETYLKETLQPGKEQS